MWLPDKLLTGDQFFSVCVPYYCRPLYLYRLIESLEKFADMPYELIVHDDGSSDGSSGDIYNLRSKITTLITHDAYPIGLAASLNRCVQMANSKYILFLNADCSLTGPCFKTFKNVLDKPYIGMVTPHVEWPTNKKEYLVSGNTKFILPNGSGGGCVQVFRKDTWKSLGGWDENFFSGSCDCAMIYKVLTYGYFLGLPIGGRAVTNMSLDEKDNSDSSMKFNKGFDCAYPKIFNLKNWQIYYALSKARQESCVQHVIGEEKREAGRANGKYWSEFMIKLVKQCTVVDWELAKRHGQDKWRSAVEADIVKETP